jgi:hypothetical protein
VIKKINGSPDHRENFVKSNDYDGTGGGLVDVNLEIFFYLLLYAGDRVVGGSQPGDRDALLVDNELSEVPLDSVHEEPALLLLKERPQGVGRPAVHVDLGEHVKGHVVLSSSKLLNLLLRAWFLAPELVAGETKDT